MVGTDASADVVAQAAADHTAPGLSFEVGDAYALPYADGEFDVVHAHQVLQHVDRPVDMLRELGRVAGPGGHVAARDVDYEGVIWYPLIPALDEWLALYLTTHRSVAGEPAAGRRLKAWAHEAGLTDIRATASLWLFEDESDRAWGAGCGPTACCSRRSPIRRARRAPMTRSCSASRTAGGSGPPPKTAGCSCRTVRSWPTGESRGDPMTTPASLPARSRLVHDAIRAVGIAGDIVVLPDAASTAPLAAAALGVEVGAIANSLVFFCDGAPLLVMTSGAHRVDTAALAARLGLGKIQRATPEQVREATGQAIGGVAPTGHPSPLRTIVDEDLAGYPEIWAAGGTPHTVFPMTYDDLVRLTQGTVAKVD